MPDCISVSADDLPQVLRQAAPARHQLPQEEVRPHLQHPTQEEAEVNNSLLLPAVSTSVDWAPKKSFWILSNLSSTLDK
jgi:hypothetical protein